MPALAIVFVSLLYCVVLACCARPIAGHYAWKFLKRDLYYSKRYSYPTNDQWFGAWCLAALAVFFWPFTIPAYYVGRHYKFGYEWEANKPQD